MKINSKMNRKQFAAAVVQQLEKYGISCVLVGGACVSIYTNERYRSHDLDFISLSSHESIGNALVEIGFKKEARYFYHPFSKFYVEFPSGPVAIGNQVPVKPEGKLKVKDTVISMLSPTQCVMDRLSAWIHWNDRRSLIHAIWVCKKHPVNLNKIKRWASKEGASKKFDQFVEQLKKAKV